MGKRNKRKGAGANSAAAAPAAPTGAAPAAAAAAAAPAPAAEGEAVPKRQKSATNAAAPPKRSGGISFTSEGAKEVQRPAAAAAAAAAGAGTAAVVDGGASGAGGAGGAGAGDGTGDGAAKKKGRPGRNARHIKGKAYADLTEDEKNTTWQRHHKAGDPISSKFVEYYKRQKLLPSEAEWKPFIETLQQPLPITFRLSAITLKRDALLARLKASLQPFFPAGAGLDAGVPVTVEVPGFRGNSMTLAPPRPWPWYPDAMGWEFKISKKELRTVKEIGAFREFLTAENEQGNLNRQEAVSMIPPLLLEVQPHHVVLDMCAAPGSKTAQLLEALHANDAVPTGLVLANDADEKRAYLLVHQTKRYKSTAFCITNHPAQFLPNIYAPTPYGKQLMAKGISFAQAAEQAYANSKGGITTTTGNLSFATPSSAAAAAGAAGAGAKAAGAAAAAAAAASALPYDNTKVDRYLEFDRILCDVPCSGDGTLRKNPNLWTEWDSNMGNGLHVLQLQIAMRAARLLKVGGEMVYSTCSFNPIENEAVVAEVLRRCNGGLELVDVSHKLPGLKRSPGMHEWQVCANRTTEWYASHAQLPPERHRQIKPSFFPPTADELKRFKLERCIRMMPHAQDSGGFFVALLRKTKPVDTKSLSWSTTVDAEGKGVAKGDGNGNGNGAPAAAAMADDADERDDTYFGGDPDDDAAGDGGDGTSAGAGAGASAAGAEAKKRRGPRQLKWSAEKSEDALVRLNNPKLAESLRQFYGLKAELRDEHIFCRSEGNKKIYILAPLVADLIAYERNARLKVVHSGQRVWERMDDKSRQLKCQYRLCQDGVSEVVPVMTRQLARCALSDFLLLLETGSVLLDDFSSAEFTRSLRAAEEGGMAIALDCAEAQAISPRPIVVVCFRTYCSLNTLMTKEERASYVSLLKTLVPNGAPAPAVAAKPAAAAAAAK